MASYTSPRIYFRDAVSGEIYSLSLVPNIGEDLGVTVDKQRSLIESYVQDKYTTNRPFLKSKTLTYPEVWLSNGCGIAIRDTATGLKLAR